MNPAVQKITKTRGVAGQVAYTAVVVYSGEEPSTVTFVGSTYGGPVVMQTPADPRGTFVTEPDRFGPFGAEWIRRFFS